MDYCRPYAAQTSQLLVTWAWQRAYSSCLMSDDDPLVPETAQGALQVIAPDLTPVPASRPIPPGDAPATDPKDDLKVDFAPPPPKSKVTGGQPQPLCTSHNKRTIYSGLHWRCVK